jgi:APA family basic amino acid/polyamine antiporter
MVIFVASPASAAALAAGSAIFLNLVSGHALDALTFSAAFGSARLSISGVQFAAIALVLLLVAVNCAPAVVNGRIAIVFAGLKIGMLVTIVVCAFALGHGERAHFSASGAGGSCAGIGSAVRNGLPGFAAALIGALYAYNGWHSLTLVAGEIEAPDRTLPTALIVSVLVVIALYVSANVAFVYIVSPLAIADLPPNSSVGVTVVETLFGAVGRSIAAGLLFVSTAATLHVTLLTYARVAYALAKDTFGFGLLARVSRRGHVPVNAVLMNGALAILLVLAGTFDTLSNYFIFNTWVFFVAVGVALFVLRRREPALPRPYRAFGYPVVPAIYVTLGAWLVVQTAISTPQSSLIGLAIVAVSLPVYFWSKRHAA